MNKIYWTLLIVTSGYAAICTLAYLAQDRLLFFPHRNHPQAVAELVPHAWQTTNGDITLQGWLRPATVPAAAPLVLYFGGNAEDVAITAHGSRTDANYLYVNYRGYGSTTGRPSEQALLSDALAVYDAVGGITSNGMIVAMGRSLGSGVAVHLAAQRQLAAVVLITPYDSMVNVAKGHYPWLPVDMLLKHRFGSAALAPDIRIPALLLIADRDTIVPPDRGLELANQWEGEATVQRFPFATHNDIEQAEGFTASMAAFINTAGGPGGLR